MKVKEFFKNLFGSLVMLNCLGMIIVSLILCMGVFYGLDIYTHHNEEIEVPDLYGQNIDVAKKKLESLGLDYLIIGKAYREKVPDRAVIIQSIAAGEKVKEGRVIELHINTLAPTLEIPEGIIGNCTLMEAKAILMNVGFKLAPVEYVKGDAKDWVVQLKVKGKPVKGGAKVSVKTPLVIVVSDGSLSESFNGTDSFFNEYVNEDVEEDESFMNYQDLEIHDEFIEETTEDKPAEQSEESNFE